MPQVTKQEFDAFATDFRQCMQRVGNRRVAIDSMCIRQLVRASPPIAYRFVELHCMMAQSQPGYLQPAFLVATAYLIEFDDDTLTKMVMDRATELGATEHLQDIGIAKDMEAARTEPSERKAAKEWWQTSGQTEGYCDNCRRPLRRGEGYLISGRSLGIGDMRVDLGEELLCPTCFYQLQSPGRQRPTAEPPAQTPPSPQSQSMQRQPSGPPAQIQPVIPRSRGIDQTLDIEQIFEYVLAGDVTVPEVEAWAEAVKPDYQRPPLTEQIGKVSDREFDRLIDQFSDWEIRISGFNRSMSHYSQEAYKLVDSHPERAILLGRTVYILCRLGFNPQSTAQGALTCGYVLWSSKHYYEAAEILPEAVAAYRQAASDRLMEITALSYLSDALHQDKQFDQALVRADELLEGSRQYGFRGHVALALRDKGQVLASLGRGVEALDCLRQALEARKTLSAEEVEQQSVVSVEAFLDALGQAARRFGRFEEAITTFGELAERHRQAGDLSLQARALSDVGYTYATAGDQEQAIQYFHQAVLLAEQAGERNDAERWRTQIDLIHGSAADQGAADQLEDQSLIGDASSAYLQNVRAQQLLKSGHYDAAAAAALAVLEWAQRHKDTHLEISIRNTLGVAYWQRSDFGRAIPEFQQGIQLADWSGDAPAAMQLRYNLAKASINQGKYQESVDILLAGIAHSHSLLDKVETSAFRQQVIAGSLGLYELYALLASHGQNHLALLTRTEIARARNLYRWLRADHALEDVAIPDSTRAQTRRALQSLRAVEVELEVRHLTGKIASSDISLLHQRRARVQDDVNGLLQQAGLPLLSWAGEDEHTSFAATEELIENTLAPDVALICLFSIPEGICPILLYRLDSRITMRGKLIRWAREERLEALTHWTGNTGLQHERGRFSTSQRDAVHVGAQHLSGFEHMLGVFREHLIGPLAQTLSQTRVRKLVVIPHRELALIPYWDLLESCPSLESLTLAPSLNVLHLCLLRHRSPAGPSVLVRDLTHTLAQAGAEIEMIQRVRAGDDVIEVDSIAALQSAAARCTLLHIAAHGLFNPDNPYFSGFLASRPDTTDSIFAQYASLPTFHITDRPDPHSLRLLTVAECMAELSLNTCLLAVLSTCESGIARQHGGGELTGLPNALLVAGAKSVIASLWPVHDTATALLMHYFYAIWEGGSGVEPSPARALADARRRLRTATREEIRGVLGTTVSLPLGDTPFSHPLYTDAFHCFGSW
jgi:CHAT domain-containing protein